MVMLSSFQLPYHHNTGLIQALIAQLQEVPEWLDMGILRNYFLGHAFTHFWEIRVKFNTIQSTQQ